jgi:hypothetical protein
VTDIVELIYAEIDPGRIMDKLSISAEPNNKYIKKYKFTKMKKTEALVEMLESRNEKFKGKELRKELNEWAGDLRRNGLLQLLGNSPANAGEGAALLNFSKSIINAFKKLPR